MPFYNNDNLFRYYSSYINEKANDKIERIKDEIEDEKKRSLARIDDEVHKRIFRNLEIELSEINSEFKLNLSRVKTEYSKVLMERRTDLLHSIVEDVTNQLSDFHKTKAYEKLMVKKVKRLSLSFCKEAVEFRVMKNDSVIKDIIKEHFKGSYKIKEISEIEIGGFSALCFALGIMTDQTIDTRLDEKRQWLFEHSKLAANQ